jgi:uncharacterized membrane protein
MCMCVLWLRLLVAYLSVSQAQASEAAGAELSQVKQQSIRIRVN